MAPLRCVSALIAALALTAPSAAADPFTVANVDVDAEAETAAAAQNAAFAQGQRIAAQRLIERLTLPEDRRGMGASRVETEAEEDDLAALIRMREGAPDGPAPSSADGSASISTAAAAELVAGLEVADEQRSATRYIATLTVNFEARDVRDYLRAQGLPFVEAQARPVLVVPVLRRSGGDAVWGGPWYEAWLEGGHEHALVPIIPLGSRNEPSGDRTEPEATPLGRRALSTRQALSLNEAALRELAALYAVERVMVVIAQERGDAVATDGVLLDFAGPQTRQASLAPVNVAIQTPPSGTGETDALAVSRALEAAYGRAAARIVEGRELVWKRQTIVRDLAESRLEVTLIYGSVREWRALQQAVAGASLVEDARLDAVSRQGAVMTLTHRGGPEQLARELSVRGARLAEEPGLGWTVRAGR